MAIKFQYNKTSLSELGKQLKMRQRALPTIKSKESALRMEVKRAKDDMNHYVRLLDDLIAQYEYMTSLWSEFDPELLTIKDVELSVTKIAGVRIPVLKGIIYEQKNYDLFSAPIWITDGIRVLKDLARLRLEREFYVRKAELLDKARKRTTQKVNLYEKVQIPGYEEAILKVKRFLEDEDNLSKSSQKIVKSRHKKMEEAV